MNVIDNALKYNHPHGSVVVKAKETSMSTQSNDPGDDAANVSTAAFPSFAVTTSTSASWSINSTMIIFVFSFLGMSVNKMSEDTIENIGTTYMQGMNEQVSLHFETIIDLRLTMAESIAHIAACWYFRLTWDTHRERQT